MVKDVYRVFKGIVGAIIAVCSTIFVLAIAGCCIVYFIILFN